MGKNNSRIVDVNTILAAGIQPTKDEMAHSLEYGKRVPTRAVDAKLKGSIKQLLRKKDEAQAITRFKWVLPEKCDITGEELERFLYYKGQLCFFYLPKLEKFFFMPYALDGTIDFYGRYNRIHPLPMANGTSESKEFAAQKDILSSIKLDCIYKENEEIKDPNSVCVLIHDYPKQMSETVISRQIGNDALLDVMSEFIPYLQTNAIAGSGVRGLKVGSDDESAQVCLANKSLKTSALSGEVFTPIIGMQEFQELLDKGSAKMSEYMEAFQSLDNFRLSTYGLDNGGVFEKSSHMLQDEQEMNSSVSSGVYDADLHIREKFCDIVNSIWPDAKISVQKVEQQDEGQNDGLSGGKSEVSDGGQDK